MAGSEKQVLETSLTPESGTTKIAQVLLRRKPKSQWEQYDQPIPIGEPCVSYDTDTGDYEFKIGIPNSEGNPQLWGVLKLVRGRVDDGELE